MKYLPYNSVKIWREKNAPDKCPVFDCGMHDCVVDHCHSSGFVRGILHRQSNAFIGKIENAWNRYGKNNSKISLPNVLRRIAHYLEQDTTDIMHAVGMKDKVSRFSRMKKGDQVNFLTKVLKCKKDEIEACNNQSDRTRLYREKTLKLYVNIN